MLNLLDLPMDLILALCRRMLLSDLISFLSSCSVLRGYTAERSLWIDVLHRTQKTEMQPIAKQIRQDLSKLNLHDLQNGARQTYRLAKNWMVPTPTPRSIQDVGYVGGDSQLIVIPGTGPRSGHRKKWFHVRKSIGMLEHPCGSRGMLCLFGPWSTCSRGVSVV
ncbi:hypothetical protein B0H14DRAFT_512071 [Mycena olivaceomarginata]|nr:hypothetical protein B0H14DRAFT_512071 [Mycena olivaceomarginata]